MNTKKRDTARICATLPREMIDDFRYKSELTGLSISRLIYMKLRSHTPLIIVPSEILSELQELRQNLGQLQQFGSLPQEVLFELRARIEQLSDLINLNSPNQVIHVTSRIQCEKKGGRI